MFMRIAKRGFIGLLVAFLVLGGTEAGLRLLQPELDEVVSPLLYQRNSGDVYTQAKTPGSRIYVSGRRRAAADVPTGKRVLVVGASAAYGEMFTAFAAFPGQAERILRHASPDVPIEFINLAHGGMGSRQVKEMVFRAVSRDKPDLIIVYSGNNEYHELRALKVRSDNYDPAAELMRRRLSEHSYIYRQLRDIIQPAETLTPPKDVDWLPIGRLDVLVNEDDRELGQLLYAEHLTEMVLAAQEHGIPILLSTVATNLRDHVDHETPGDFPPTAQARLHQLGEMMDKTERSVFLAAADAAQPLLQSEGAQFQLGQLFIRGGLRDAAFKSFENAEMMALRPMTSDRRLRQIAKEVSTELGAPLCDLAGALAAGSKHGSPGNDLFIDHCHPNVEGHRRLGLALANCIVEHDLLQLDIGDADLSATLERLAEIPRDPYRLDQFTGHRHLPGAKVNPPAGAGTPLGETARGHLAFVSDRYDAALAHYVRAEQLGSPAAATSLNTGLTQLYRGDLSAARKAVDRALEQAPEDADIQQLRATLGP